MLKRISFVTFVSDELDILTVTIVAPEDLILSKLEWAKESRSQMQLDDVRNLFRSVENLDHAYLDRWADRLGLAELYREVQHDA